jgi:hypothetical protein
MHARTATTLLHSLQMGFPNLRCSAFRADDAVQATCVLQEPVSHAWTCKLGYNTQLRILGSVHCYIPEYVFPLSVCSPYVILTYICSMVLFQALHLPITRLPEFSESPAKSSRRICVKVFLCTRWIPWCAFSLRGGKTETRRACYVRSAEGPGECLVDGKRQGLGLSYRAFWRDACKCSVSN